MRIAIITLPILSNYGGILQNFALQNVVKKLQYDVETVDYLRIPTSSLYVYLCSWLKSFILYFTSRRRRFTKYSHKGIRIKVIEDFLEENIKITKKIYAFNVNLLDKYDAIIVGSDQVWRPKYNYKIENMFLDFAKGKKITKSFNVK